MAKQSTGNFIFLLVFALLCGDWSEPAKAKAGIGEYKGVTNAEPVSSKISTETFLVAQANGKPDGKPDKEICTIPGRKTNGGEIRLDDGACVPSGCIDSNYNRQNVMTSSLLIRTKVKII